MRFPTTKWIPVSEATIGEEYVGYKRTHNDREVVTFGYPHPIYTGNGFVNNKIKVTELEKEMTWEEQDSLAKSMFNLNDSTCRINLEGLFTDLYSVGDATHEMWNAWIDTDWYRMNAGISDEDFCIIGIAPIGLRSGFKEPVGIVCEYSDGSRFWCHVEKEWVDEMKEQMKDIYNTISEQ